MAVYTYDSNDVNFLFNTAVVTGLAEGEALEAGQNEESFTKQVGMHGDVTLSETTDKTGFMKVKLKSTSPFCQTFDQQANKTGEAALFSGQIVDLTTNGISAGGTKCRFKKMADKKWGTEETEREYEIEVVDFTAK